MTGKPNVRLPDDQLTSLLAAILLSRNEDIRLDEREIADAVQNARDLIKCSEQAGPSDQ